MRAQLAKVKEFVVAYVLDIHVLLALAVPIVFCLLFPIYWFLICPRIWIENPHLFHPRSWLVAYWLFASFVWFIFLAFCYVQSRHEIRHCCTSSKSRSNSKKSGSDSPEDIWSEDQYISPEVYLPKYSVNTVQPLEEKREMDETWEYDFDENPSGYHQYCSLGLLNEKRTKGTVSKWRKFSEPNELFSATGPSTNHLSGSSGDQGSRNVSQVKGRSSSLRKKGISLLRPKAGGLRPQKPLSSRPSSACNRSSSSSSTSQRKNSQTSGNYYNEDETSPLAADQRRSWSGCSRSHHAGGRPCNYQSIRQVRRASKTASRLLPSRRTTPTVSITSSKDDISTTSHENKSALASSKPHSDIGFSSIVNSLQNLSAELENDFISTDNEDDEFIRHGNRKVKK